MAELNPCCAPEAQSTRREPDAKDACCGGAASGGWTDCIAGAPTRDQYERPLRKAGVTCALDDQQLTEQLARFAAIGAHAVWARRLPREVTVRLDDDLDDTLLQETLAIEAACCPFLGLIWDERRRELTIVSRDADDPILDRVAAALG